MRVTPPHPGLALVGLLVVVAAHLSCTADANETLTVIVTRRDLRPLPGVTLQLAGAVNLPGVTDQNGHATFPDLPAAGAVTITPSRSGFRFEPPQLTIPDLSTLQAAWFTAFPMATDLALSAVSDDPTPRVGGPVHGVITLRNLGNQAATDVTVGYGSLPGLALEHGQATEGALETRGVGMVWKLPQLDPSAFAELHVHSRATLPDASEFGPRAGYDWLAPNVFLTQLRPGESATASFYVTPTRVGTVTGFVNVQQSDQTDPHPENGASSFRFEVGPAPPIPQIMRLRKVRTDFFDQTPIAEVEIDQAALNRLAPFSLFQLEGSSDLKSWEFLTYAGFLPLVPITFTDRAGPGDALRAFRLRQ
jgi:hypothetical protein